MDVIAGCARPVRRHARHFRRRTQSGGSGHVDALGRTEECLPCKAWATHLPVIERFRFARSSFKPAWKTTNGACWSRWSADDTRRALRAAVSDLLPEQIVQRPKSMYPSAVDDVFDAAVRRRARALLDNGSVVGEFLDRVRVEALIDGTSARPPWLQRLSLAYLDQIDRWLASFDVRLDAAA